MGQPFYGQRWCQSLVSAREGALLIPSTDIRYLVIEFSHCH